VRARVIRSPRAQARWKRVLKIANNAVAAGMQRKRTIAPHGNVPASKSLEHVGSIPTRRRGIMPMIKESSRRSIKLFGKDIEFLYDTQSFLVN
jgi:hypothetical protein